MKEIVEYCKETTKDILIPTKLEYNNLLIGIDNFNIKKLREEYPSVRIIFPSEFDNEQNHTILLLGKKEEAEAVKKFFEEQIADLRETSELILDINSKYHRYFRRLVKSIQKQTGCQILFPRGHSLSSRVILKGSKNSINAAKEKIEKIISDKVKFKKYCLLLIFLLFRTIKSLLMLKFLRYIIVQLKNMLILLKMSLMLELECLKLIEHNMKRKQLMELIHQT